MLAVRSIGDPHSEQTNTRDQRSRRSSVEKYIVPRRPGMNGEPLDGFSDFGHTLEEFNAVVHTLSLYPEQPDNGTLRRKTITTASATRADLDQAPLPSERRV
jgi:hypothetical protein